MSFRVNKSSYNLPLYVLVTVTDRNNFHLTRTIPSLLRQSKKWDNLIVVDDSINSADEIKRNFINADLSSLTLIKNSRTKGAAGAWNTGLDYVASMSNDAWIAILDDDDEWTAEHLESCLNLTNRNFHAVISSILTFVDDKKASNPFNGDFSVQDFLHRNPGWQGSNTFVKLSALDRAGRFDEAMVCTHDRDLAIRLLSLNGFTYTRTGITTVKYHIDTNVPAYTRRLNPQKLSGLRSFWSKHNTKMTPEIKENFFNHATDMFGFSREQITQIS